MKFYLLILSCLFFSMNLTAQDQLNIPPETDARLYDIAEAPSPARIEQDIRRLVEFGTRNTLSDTVSTTRGIGAARRWIHEEFEKISTACGGCLEVSYQYHLIPAEGNRRIPEDT